jgi:uncharacterized SAM-binding protein YcdF (DUF218 family)
MESASSLSPSFKPLQKGRSFRRLSAATLSLILLVAGVWLGGEPLLRGAADVWIVSDPITHADAVAVLGGGLEVRPFAAAELYKKGLVAKILVSQVAEEGMSKFLAIPGHSELNRMVLLKLGIPEAAIEMFGKANSSTWDEAAALKGWADQHGVSRIVIPTGIFSARRVRWIFNREFAGSSVQFEISSLEGPGYTRAEWWKTEAGLVAFHNEIIKYLYYRLKY